MRHYRRVEIRRVASAAAFLGIAGDFLTAREAEHNLILGICSSMMTDPTIFPEAPYFGMAVHDGRVVATAVHTPPRDLVLSETDARASVAAFLDDLTGVHLPGVLGPTAVSAAFAAGWSARSGIDAAFEMGERAFRLRRVVPPRAAAGRMRPAELDDRELVVEWLRAFAEEAFGTQPPWDPEELADRWIARRGRTLELWEDADQVVSMAGIGGRTPNGIRIGPVYTPPDQRGQGYASNLVAAATQAQLDAGRTFVFLFTDRANPTSNHIYQAIGFEPVTDIDRYRFG
jgi:predicted GNAT family acetyltransferase